MKGHNYVRLVSGNVVDSQAKLEKQINCVIKQEEETGASLEDVRVHRFQVDTLLILIFFKPDEPDELTFDQLNEFSLEELQSLHRELVGPLPAGVLLTSPLLIYNILNRDREEEE